MLALQWRRTGQVLMVQRSKCPKAARQAAAGQIRTWTTPHFYLIHPAQPHLFCHRPARDAYLIPWQQLEVARDHQVAINLCISRSDGRSEKSIRCLGSGSHIHQRLLPLYLFQSTGCRSGRSSKLIVTVASNDHRNDHDG